LKIHHSGNTIETRNNNAVDDSEGRILNSKIRDISSEH